MMQRSYPAGNYMFKVNNRNTRTRKETCSKLTVKTPERRRLGIGTYFNSFIDKNEYVESIKPRIQKM